MMLLKSKSSKMNDELRKTILIGFFIRLFLLLFILIVGTEFTSPHFISDDIKYEEIALKYLDAAKGIIDPNMLARISKGYKQPFWPIVMCISAYAFRSIYAARFLNIIFSTVCIYIIYRIVQELSNDQKTALKGAKLFAYLPVTIFTCCFPIKDIYITMGVFYAFYLFVLVQNKQVVKKSQILIGVLLLVGVYFARGAVTEMLLIFFGAYILIRFQKNKQYGLFFLGVVAIGVFLYLFKDGILNAFETKLKDYGEDLGTGNGIRLIQIKRISDIYRLPFAYFFASLQPATLNFLASAGASSVWLSIITYLNISIYPIAIGNFLYIFTKKRNAFFWFSTFVMYSAVIILSLGVFRHYLFLLPVEIINYSLFTKEKSDGGKLSLLLAIGLFVMIALFGMMR